MRANLILTLLLTSACGATVIGCEASPELRDRQAVREQQNQYAAGQPIPRFDWSLERDLLISLYRLRNQEVATHSVWRSDFGTVEGDCASIGFGLPYDTSLTNPLQHAYSGSGVAIGQAEPNGVFASTNTAATWVMCAGDDGSLLPVYVESKVTVFPYPVEVDYENNRVSRAGDAAATLETHH